MQKGMIGTFLHVKGNPRACLWTEPLWGIPYNLYAPYIALYMVGLGLTTAEIGYVTSISLVIQIIAAVLSGPLADKMGRRLCTYVVDVIAWTIPTLLWAFSQNYIWFVVAALFNGFWRTTGNSWGLLLTEGSDNELVMRCFALTQLMGVVAAFFAPLSKLAVDTFGVVPTMRVLYLFACASMTLKFYILYKVGTETEMGKRRMEETKNQSVWQLIRGCEGVFLRMIREKRMILTIGVLASYLVITTLNTSFWAVYITKQLGIAEGDVALYTTFRSLIIMGCIFLIVPRLRFSRFKKPDAGGLGRARAVAGFASGGATRTRAGSGADLQRRAGGDRAFDAVAADRLAALHQCRPRGACPHPGVDLRPDGAGGHPVPGAGGKAQYVFLWPRRSGSTWSCCWSARA